MSLLSSSIRDDRVFTFFTLMVVFFLPPTCVYLVICLHSITAEARLEGHADEPRGGDTTEGNRG